MYKKLLVIVISVVMIGVFYNHKVAAKYLNSLNVIETPIKVGVFLMTDDDPYVYLIGKALEEVEKKSEGTVIYNIYYAQRDQDLQNKQVNEVLQKKEVNLILINLVKEAEAKYAIDRVRERNIPIIFFGGANMQAIQTYSKAYWLGMDPNEGGIVQGEVVIDLWNKNKQSIDKNKDNILQYIMLRGPVDNTYATGRTVNSIATINRVGIQTEELALRVGNWSEEEAREAIEVLFPRFGNNIEMIIANNDAMAIGAINALQKYGYNLENGLLRIEVVGFDGIEEALNLIEKRIMSGTVIQDPHDYAEALYISGMNLVYSRDPVLGTEYIVSDLGSSIIIPHKGIVTKLDVNSNF